jgi:hypothetical protein
MCQLKWCSSEFQKYSLHLRTRGSDYMWTFRAADARTRRSHTTDTWWPCTSVERDSVCRMRQWTACTAARTSGWARNQSALPQVTTVFSFSSTFWCRFLYLTCSSNFLSVICLNKMMNFNICVALGISFQRTLLGILAKTRAMVILVK